LESATRSEVSIGAAALSLGQTLSQYQQQLALGEPMGIASHDGRDEIDRKRREANNPLLAGGGTSLNP